jgi:hypothetical protein
MSATGEGPAGGGGRQPTEEELRAAYEAEIKKIRVEQILLEHVVTLVNLGMRRTGIAPGTESERDPGQVRIAIEALRALLPIVEQAAPQQAAPIRDALSQLQLAYVRMGEPSTEAADTGAPPPGAGAASEQQPQAAEAPPSAPDQPPSEPGEPGPAQRSGRLWVPGQ